MIKARLTLPLGYRGTGIYTSGRVWTTYMALLWKYAKRYPSLLPPFARVAPVCRNDFMGRAPAQWRTDPYSRTVLPRNEPGAYDRARYLVSKQAQEPGGLGGSCTRVRSSSLQSVYIAYPVNLADTVRAQS